MSASLSNATSGLNAVSRAAEVVSSNVANAMTESYGRRELSLGAATVGGQGAGVQINGIERVVNETAIADRRLAQAELGYQSTRSEALASIEQTVGSPTSSASLGSLMGQFEQDLITASITPSDSSALSSVVNSAIGLTDKINEISDHLIDLRDEADSAISRHVADLNTGLSNVDRLNGEIRTQLNSGGDASGLMDQRQAVIDSIGAIVPVQTVARDFGQVALVTPNGTTLVDYQAASFEFVETGVITPDMTLETGALSGLKISGASSVSGTAIEAISGGALSADFELRDQEIPKIQANLDALSRDLMDRASSADGTLGLSDAGLFTDNGGTLDPLYEAGLSSRLSVNSAVIAADGGEAWRIRDGIAAIDAGPASNNELLNAYADSFSQVSSPLTGAFSDAGSSADLIGQFLTQISQERHASEQRESYEIARVQTLSDVERSGGVDTDQELQKLLLIERNYAANAKVIQVVDEMLESLLRI
ncbi:MAG: flagellar hook-associated protein FlgK [Litoreibacter sp.]|uniref:flagellar hook-associated protein FlgK n=1 Tax=Litoreibacter sp. TaxID=1969459 RepID=UPI003297F7FD